MTSKWVCAFDNAIEEVLVGNTLLAVVHLMAGSLPHEMRPLLVMAVFLYMMRVKNWNIYLDEGVS